jgi:hypothetical protein
MISDFVLDKGDRPAPLFLGFLKRTTAASDLHIRNQGEGSQTSENHRRQPGHDYQLHQAETFVYFHPVEW